MLLSLKKQEGYIKLAKGEDNGQPIDANFCCNMRCGINGTVVGSTCIWIKDKSVCKSISQGYYAGEISIGGSRYNPISNDLLWPIYSIFRFDDFNEKYYPGDCVFQTKEDLLINFSDQINGKFIYSLGGGHKHFDARLMDTSEGRALLEKQFLIYPTYGVAGTVDGVYYDDRNVLGYDCSGLSMALIHLVGGYDFDRENTNAQKMYNIAKEKKLLKKEIKIGYALFYGKSESSINHVTIALGENKMIEAPGHHSNKTGKPIKIVNIRTPIGIADFISNESNESKYLKLSPFLLLFLFVLNISKLINF